MERKLGGLIVTMFAVAALLAGVPATAQTVYKLIDKNGKVTYAEQPPKYFEGQVIRIDIDPNANKATLGKPGGDPGQQASRAKAKREAEEARAETHAEKLQAAREKLDEARQALDDARNSTNDDDFRWVGNVGGGTRRVPTEQYQERLAGLERKVKEAEDEVKQLQGDH
jgi:hypothetical protein